MRASPEDQARVQRALENLEAAARDAREAHDTEAMRVRLACVWVAVRMATQTVNDVEESTRMNALRQLEKVR